MSNTELEKLGKLNELKEKGIISQEEFDEQKKELLSSSNSKNKSKKQSVFLWLAVLLGPFGIHNFYIGEKTKGFIKLFPILASIINEDDFHMFIIKIVLYIWIIIEIFNTKKTSTGIDMVPTSKTYRNVMVVCFVVLCTLDLFVSYLRALGRI